MKKLAYIGLERCDFIYHLATILSTQGRVLITDNTYAQDLKMCVDKEDKGLVERKNIHYTNNLDIEMSEIDEYDYAILYAGLNLDNLNFAEYDSVLVMPDYTDITLREIEKANIPSNAIYIIRDNCTKKVTDRGIALRLGLNIKEIDGHLSYSMTDMAAYVALTHNGHANVKSVSQEMTTALTYVTSRFFETDEKKASKIVATARKVK